MIPTPDTFPSLFAGYTALFGILAIYLVILGRKASRIERELRLSSNIEGGATNDSTI